MDTSRLRTQSAAAAGIARPRLRGVSLRTAAARRGLGQPHAEPVAIGTRPLRAVGGKERRADLRIRELAFRTHQPLREAPFRSAIPTVVDQDIDHVAPVPERGVQRVGQPRRNVGFDDQTVDDDLQHVAGRLRVGPCRRSGRNLVGQIVNPSANPHAHEPRAPQFLERGVAARGVIGPQRRQHLDTAARGQVQQTVHDLRHAVPFDHAPALLAVRRPDPGVQHPQRVGDLAGGPHGRARRMDRRLVRNAQRRRQPLDRIDLRLGALGQKLAGIGRQRLHVAPAPLGIQHVERQRRFPRPGHAGHDDELVARNGNGNVLEIVLARATNDDFVHGREPSRKLRPGRLSLPRRESLRS